jgi:hypothetical protein
MSTNDGGPAFPTHESNYEGHLYCSGAGMALRDYFAAKAMQAYIARVPFPAATDTRHCADMAYIAADAMLAARSKT